MNITKCINTFVAHLKSLTKNNNFVLFSHLDLYVDRIVDSYTLSAVNVRERFASVEKYKSKGNLKRKKIDMLFKHE